uniref:Uncharacterized protein n=1 Tax=Sinocyclocheilus grahami TaxID=75366 RepID=A0A672JZ41_SINGR
MDIRNTFLVFQLCEICFHERPEPDLICPHELISLLVTSVLARKKAIMDMFQTGKAKKDLFATKCVGLDICMFSEEAILPYNKPSFPSPGGHSSSGTASSKGSTGPRKGEGTRGQHQRSNTDEPF